MSVFPSRREDVLCAEDVPLEDIAARFGTPCYVYSKASLVAAWRAFENALSGCDHLVCFAVKANSNLAVINLFAMLGAGFDIVSGGELRRVLAAGGSASRTVFSGVGKSREEMAFALSAGVACFNVESAAELEALEIVAAAHGVRAPVSLRVNPDVDPGTHPYIATGLRDSKFGVSAEEAPALYRRAAASNALQVVGIDCHIGSQILSTSPFVDALDRVLALVDQLDSEGIRLSHIDVGGGVGIRYRDEAPLAVADYVAALRARLGGHTQRILMEPGRALVGSAGLLLTRVEYLKSGVGKDFAIIDAAMNDLLRPALYEAYHRIEPVRSRAGPPARYDVVGPVCESGDFLGLDRELALQAGDLLAVLDVGAYGSAMSSNYNARPRAAEVMVDGDRVHLVRVREDVSRLYEGESVLPAAALEGLSTRG